MYFWDHDTREEIAPECTLDGFDSITVREAEGKYVDEDGENDDLFFYAVYDNDKLALERLIESRPGSEKLAEAIVVSARAGQTDVVKMLIEAGADLESRNLAGQTPLICAATGGHVRLVELLLDLGADIHAKTSGGYDALRSATAVRADKVVDILRSRLSGACSV